MKIWIDGYEANIPQRLGSSQVSFELLKHLELIDRENDFTVLLPRQPMDDLPKERKGWRYRVLKPHKLWTRIALPAALYLSKDKPDVIFSPTHYMPRFSPVKRIVTIFDLSYLHFPQMFNSKDLWQLKNWSKYSIENATHILTISNFSKEDIIKSYNLDASKITVAYPGYDKEVFKVIQDKARTKIIQTKYKTGNNYIICVGTIQPRKNLIGLIEAMKYVNSTKLIIVGKTMGAGRQAWMFEDTLKAPMEFGVEDKIIFTGFVPTEELQLLLNGAKAFVLPSLWEGFGIPVLEAMACGTSVCLSNVSSLPEVAGDAGVYFDPYNVKDIAKAVNRLLLDDKLRVKKVQLGLEQVKKFSWDNFAKKALQVCKGVVDGNL